MMNVGNKIRIIVTSAVTLAPAIAGAFLWDTVPDFMGGWEGDERIKAFAILGLPLVLFIAHVILLASVFMLDKTKNQDIKAQRAMYWVIPFISVYSFLMIYHTAVRGNDLFVFTFPAFLGLIFAFIGNYLPKTRQNKTVGIRLPWTLADEENWAVTHRFTGKLWMAGGLMMMLVAFTPFRWGIWVFIAILAVMVTVPVFYSWSYAKQHGRNEKVKVKKIHILPVLILSVFVFLILFTGEIHFTAEDDALTIKTAYWFDSQVRYGDIESLDYMEKADYGYRTSGFGSPRLSIGAFYSDQLGNYTRYAYTDTEPCVIIKGGGKVLVLSGKNSEDTRQLYDDISDKIK